MTLPSNELRAVLLGLPCELQSHFNPYWAVQLKPEQIWWRVLLHADLGSHRGASVGLERLCPLLFSEQLATARLTLFPAPPSGPALDAYLLDSESKLLTHEPRWLLWARQGRNGEGG